MWAIIEDMNIGFFMSGLVIRIAFMFQPTRLNFYMFAREYQELGPVASLYALGRFSDSAPAHTPRTPLLLTRSSPHRYNLMFIVDSTSIFLCMFKVMKYLRLSPRPTCSGSRSRAPGATSCSSSSRC